MIESPRHDLDQVIDRIAAKMVAMPDDAGLLSRTLARLPERTATPWFLSTWAQLAAAAAIVAVALVYPRPSREFAPIESVLEPAPLALAKPAELSPEAPVGEPVLPAVDVRLPTPTSASATVGRPDSRLPVAALDRPDHERSLAPVDAIEAIEMGGIAPPAMELDAAAVLEPLVLTDLSLETEGDF